MPPTPDDIPLNEKQRGGYLQKLIARPQEQSPDAASAVSGETGTSICLSLATCLSTRLSPETTEEVSPTAVRAPQELTLRSTQTICLPTSPLCTAVVVGISRHLS